MNVYEIDVKTDCRGQLAELFGGDHLGRIYVFTIEPGQVRGGHYHRILHETFILLHGSVIMEGGKETVQMKPFTGYNVQPSEYHRFTNDSTSQAVIIVRGSEKFDVKNPDTYFDERSC